MSRLTIDFGIDLGTTNSAIARLESGQTRVFKSPAGAEYTPSAVWIDERNRLHVGQTGKDHLEDDPENAASEFKLLMGLNHPKVFARSGKRMAPADLSAWVLKAVKRDAERATGEPIQAAVITVPAAFQAPQKEATKEAARQAGLVDCPMIHEPEAAGLAYGFQSEKENVYWLVYDLGGGTFDAAVIQARGGEVRVVAHEGDNRLGGKLFDWDIVEKLFVPALNRSGASLPDFRRGNPRWGLAFARLKWWAEEAKVRLSGSARSVPVAIESLCQDDRGRAVRFDFELTRSDVEALIEPYLVRTVNICRKALADARLGADHLDKVLLVGGPTQTPFLRQYLMDQKDGLGAPLDYRVCPMTVVARGAAIFAATQHLSPAARPVPPPGAIVLDLDYSPVGTDLEPLVGGRARGRNQNYGGYTIELVQAEPRPGWRSGRIDLQPDGAFLINLFAQKGAANLYHIEMYNATGSRVPTSPDRLTYTVGKVFTEAPCTHSLGVAMADNNVDWLIPKGAPLPAKGRSRHRTAHAIRPDGDEALTIPVVEGENSRADRNCHIGSLVVTAQRFRRGIPAGTEVEVRLEVDRDDQIQVRAYFPSIDAEFPATISYKEYDRRSRDLGQLSEEVGRERARLQQVRARATQQGDARARELLARIDAERIEEQVSDLLAAARGDPEAALACRERLLRLRAAIDDAEDALEWPDLRKEALEALESLRKVVGQFGDGANARAGDLHREVQQALDARDPATLRRKLREVEGLKIEILAAQPVFWAMMLDDLDRRRDSFRDRRQAEHLLEAGRQAEAANQVASLRAAVQQLIALLPVEQQRQVQGLGASTVRA